MTFGLFSLIRVFITSQEEYSPEDPANPCVNYPTEEYESYADCDDHFVRRILPPGLKPFWTVDNISDATDNFYLENKIYDYWYYYGINIPGFLSSYIHCFHIQTR